MAAVLLFLVACGGPPRPPSRVVKFESEIQAARLKNGIRVLVAEDHSTNLVEVGVRFSVGSSSDPEGKAGLAHLVEHLMFQVRADGRPIAAEMTSVAIGFNAYTSLDSTHYMTTARADQLDRVLELEALRFGQGCSTISEATFQREREVVRNELRVRGSGVFSGLVEYVVEQVYPEGHPYRSNVVGDDGHLSALTLQDACEFVEAHYRPDRMMVVISGRVNSGDATNLVGKHLGPLSGRSSSGAETIPPLAGYGRTVRYKMATDTPAILIAWRMPARHSDAYPAAAIAIEVFETILMAKGQIGFSIELGGVHAPIAVTMVPLLDDEKDIKKALKAVWDAADQTGGYRGGYDFEHFENRRARGLLTRFDALRSRVDGFADAMQFDPDRHFFVRRLQVLDKMTGKDVANAAKHLLQEDRATIVIIEPSDEEGSPLEQSSLSYRGHSHEADEWKAPIDAAEARRALQLPLAPSMLESAEEFELKNGLRVIMLQTPAAPVMTAHMVFAGGSADDPKGKSGLATLGANLLGYQGIYTGNSDDTAVYTALYRFGDAVRADVDADHTVFTVNGLSSHMDAMLAGISGLVHDGVYRTSSLAARRRYIDRSKEKKNKGKTTKHQKKTEQRTKSYRKFGQSLYETVYGPNHPYAQDVGLQGTQQARDISLQDLEAYRKRHFNAQNGVLIVTGQYDAKLTKQHVQHWFGELRSGEAFELKRPTATVKSERSMVSVPGENDQPTSTILVAWPQPRNEERRAERLVMARIVNERVSRIRHSLGAGYAVKAQTVENVGPGMLLVTAIVDSKRTDEALQAIMTELNALRSADTDLSEEFARARRQVLKSLLADESGARHTASLIAALVKDGKSLNYYTSLAQQVMRLTVDDLLPVLREELAVEKEYVGLYGPAASIKAASDAVQVP